MFENGVLDFDGEVEDGFRGEVFLGVLKDVVHFVDDEADHFLFGVLLDAEDYDALLWEVGVLLSAEEGAEVDDGDHCAVVVDDALDEGLGEGHGRGLRVFEYVSDGLGVDSEEFAADLERCSRFVFFHSSDGLLLFALEALLVVVVDETSRVDDEREEPSPMTEAPEIMSMDRRYVPSGLTTIWYSPRTASTIMPTRRPPCSTRIILELGRSLAWSWKTLSRSMEGIWLPS